MVALFPQSQTSGQRRQPLHPILMDLSQPFPKFIKKLSLWCKEKRFDLWQSCLQSEKLVSMMGWLLFLTNMMSSHLITYAIFNYHSSIYVPAVLFYEDGTPIETIQVLTQAILDIHSHSSLVLPNMIYSHTDLCAASHHPHCTLAINSQRTSCMPITIEITLLHPVNLPLC